MNESANDRSEGCVSEWKCVCDCESCGEVF